MPTPTACSRRSGSVEMKPATPTAPRRARCVRHYGKRILWRGSATNPAWKPTVVVMDYVKFPLGYATNFLGLDFYQT